MITIQEFKASIENDSLPSDLPPSIQALWHDARGEWTKAHSLIDHLDDKSSSHVHAYLHRKEGDIRNADYWYQKAGKIRPEISLDEEWQQLLAQFLK